jgi:hypothetical protein
VQADAADDEAAAARAAAPRKRRRRRRKPAGEGAGSDRPESFDTSPPPRID